MKKSDTYYLSSAPIWRALVHLCVPMMAAMSVGVVYNIINGGFIVSVGQHVDAGQPIAHVGTTGHSTGYHCHFEVRINNVQTDPIAWMRNHGAPIG